MLCRCFCVPSLVFWFLPSLSFLVHLSFRKKRGGLGASLLSSFVWSWTRVVHGVARSSIRAFAHYALLCFNTWGILSVLYVCSHRPGTWDLPP